MASVKRTLAGLYFHSFNDVREVEWQGVVLYSPEPGFYLVELYNWLTGVLDGTCRLVPLEQMRSWQFYEAVETMVNTYNNQLRNGHGT